MLSYLPYTLSSFAADIDGVIRFVYIICGVWLFVAEVVLFALIWAGRGRASAGWVPGTGWRAASWVLGPVALVLVCDFAIEADAAPVWEHVKIDLPESDFHVKITARQFAWVYAYPGADGQLDTPDDIVTNELHVPVDTPVRFHLEAADVLHAFYVPELRLKQDAVPGRSIEGWFDANKEGTYEVACAEICGRGHTRMASTLVVASRSAVDSWLQSLQ